MNVDVLTDDKIADAVLRVLDKPLRLVELREELQRHGIHVSYARLKRIVDELVVAGKVRRFKHGKAIMYIKKEVSE